MSAEPEPTYRAKILGTVTSQQREMVGTFIASGGIAEFNQLLAPHLKAIRPFRESSTAPILEILNPLLEELAMSQLFTRERTSITDHLPQPYNQAWTAFVQTAAQALGRSHLRSNGIVDPSETFVPGRSFARGLKAYKKSKLVTDEFNEFYVGSPQSGQPYGIPGDTVLQPEVFGARVSLLVDYNPSPKTDDYERRRVKNLRRSLSTEYGRKYTRFALSRWEEFAGYGPEWINIPDKENERPKIIQVVGSLPRTETTTEKTSTYDRAPVGLGMNMEIFSFWALRMITGKIKEQEDWRNYFQPVNSSQ